MFLAFLKKNDHSGVINRLKNPTLGQYVRVRAQPFRRIKPNPITKQRYFSNLSIYFCYPQASVLHLYRGILFVTLCRAEGRDSQPGPY